MSVIKLKLSSKKMEAAMPTEVQLYVICLITADSFCRSLPPVLPNRNCKNDLLHRDKMTTEFRLLGFYIHRLLFFGICTPSVLYRVTACFLWIFSQELHMWYFSHNLQLDLHVNSYLSFPWCLIVPAVAQLSDFGWLQCLKGTAVICVF